MENTSLNKNAQMQSSENSICTVRPKHLMSIVSKQALPVEAGFTVVQYSVTNNDL
jgi:hypothetical protein